MRLVKALASRFRSTTGSSGTPGGFPVASSGEQLRVASYNVHKCIGADGRRDPARTLRVLQELDADVIALQEADMRFGARQGILDLEALKAEAGYDTLQNIGSKAESHGWHGNMLLFRHGRVSSVERLVLPGLEPRGALIADLELPHGSLRIIAAHLGLLRQSRAKQVSLLLNAAQPSADRPVIVMGDMNEWRLGKRSALNLFSPHFGPTDQLVASFPAGFPLLPLDRVLVSGNLKLLKLEAHSSAAAMEASDHLPIKALIEVPALAPLPRHWSAHVSAQTGQA